MADGETSLQYTDPAAADDLKSPTDVPFRINFTPNLALTPGVNAAHVPVLAALRRADGNITRQHVALLTGVDPAELEQS